MTSYDTMQCKCNKLHLKFLHLYIPSIIHFADIDHLLPSASGDFVGMFLAHESLVGGFDCVHGISGSSHAGGEVVYADTAADFPYVLLAADSETWTSGD